tara:strand:- start:380 stop:1309 length:930 start_codon:yes stop_codon:yes gene_type:complete
MPLPPPFIQSQKNSLVKKNVEIDSFTVIGKGLSGYLSNLKFLKDKLNASKYDIIHAHYVFSGWLALLTFSKIPLVLSFMGSDVYGTVDHRGNKNLKGLINYFLSMLIQPFVDQIIVKSYNLSKYIYMKRKMKIIPNGVDFDVFKQIDRNYCKEILNLSKKKKYVLFLANKKNPRKNFPLLQSAMDLINDSNITLFDLAYPVSPAKVPLILNASSVLVLTSFYEGSPNVIKEAMACNIPIVSVDVGDVREVCDGVEGCVISKTDPLSIAEAIKSTIGTHQRTQGRKNIERLKINKVAAEIKLLYKSLLAK